MPKGWEFLKARLNQRKAEERSIRFYSRQFGEGFLLFQATKELGPGGCYLRTYSKGNKLFGFIWGLFGLVHSGLALFGWKGSDFKLSGGLYTLGWEPGFLGIWGELGRLVLVGKVLIWNFGPFKVCGWDTWEKKGRNSFFGGIL